MTDPNESLDMRIERLCRQITIEAKRLTSDMVFGITDEMRAAVKSELLRLDSFKPISVGFAAEHRLPRQNRAQRRAAAARKRLKP